LREWCRLAVDKDDMHALVAHASAAEHALVKLTPEEMDEYKAWLDCIDPGWFERYRPTVARAKPRRGK
jgi:hypothetical protein